MPLALLNPLPAAIGPRLRQHLTRLVLIAVCGLPAPGWAWKSLKNGAERPPATPCDEMTAHLPNVSAALCREAKLVPGPARSVKGRSILLRDLPNPEAKLRVLVLGGMHGDELSSTSVALHWLSLAQDQPMQLPQPDDVLGPRAEALERKAADQR